MRDVYNSLVKWFIRLEKGKRLVALWVMVLVVVAEIVVVYVRPDIIFGSAVPAGTVPKGYDHYTPVYWLIALFTVLIAAFLFRYHNYKRLDDTIATVNRLSLLPWVQIAIVVFTLVALVVEVYLLVYTETSISQFVRDIALEQPAAYWWGGAVAALIAGVVIDLMTLSSTTKLMLIVWVAVLAHIFWWL